MIRSIERAVSGLRGLVGVRLLRLNKTRTISLGSILEKQTRKQGDKPLILFEDRQLTYRQFNAAANRCAHFFSSQGLARGDTVILMMDNRPEYLIIHAGLAKIGVVSALVNTQIRGRALIHACNAATARAMVLGHECLSEYQRIASALELQRPGTVFVENEGRAQHLPENLVDLGPLLAGQPDVNPVPPDPVTTKDILEYCYTSGTTGLPKAMRVLHHKWIQIGLGAGGFCMRATAGDVLYCCIPLHHNSGINMAWSITVMNGATLALRRKFSATGFWDDIRQYGATLFVYVGELCRYLYNQPERPYDSEHSLRCILGTGIRGDYWEGFQCRFGIKRIIEVYGTTEGVGALTNTRGVPGMIGRLRSAGMRIGEVAVYDHEKECLVRNGRGFIKKCRPGETGMFLARINDISPFPGYRNSAEATAVRIIRDVFRPGDCYFVSNDLMHLHDNHYVSFVDRLGDSFRWKGELVSTNEVADILNHFEGVTDSNVYGVEVNGCEGRAGMAALTIPEGLKMDMGRFAAYVTESLPNYACPLFVRLRDEMDITASFKQRKFVLQKEGFDPNVINDPLYFLDSGKKSYLPLTREDYLGIQAGQFRF